MNFGFREEMGFESRQIKQLLLSKPKLWIMSNKFYKLFQIFTFKFHLNCRQRDIGRTIWLRSQRDWIGSRNYFTISIDPDVPPEPIETAPRIS